jgi:hypothetical protein
MCGKDIIIVLSINDRRIYFHNHVQIADKVEMSIAFSQQQYMDVVRTVRIQLINGYKYGHVLQNDNNPYFAGATIDLTDDAASIPLTFILPTVILVVVVISVCILCCVTCKQRSKHVGYCLCTC